MVTRKLVSFKLPFEVIEHLKALKEWKTADRKKESQWWRREVTLTEIVEVLIESEYVKQDNTRREVLTNGKPKTKAKAPAKKKVKC